MQNSIPFFIALDRHRCGNSSLGAQVSDAVAALPALNRKGRTGIR